MTFSQLRVGQWFDFIGPNATFYLRCVKTTDRTYRDEQGLTHRVGSVKAVVYHVISTLETAGKTT